MYRRMDHGAALRVIRGAALVGALGWSTASIAQTTAAKQIPDAQVEANVLRALASAQDLANQPITTTTVYGVVTLSGSAQTEELRTEAETLTSRAVGVQKVVDEMILSGNTVNPGAQAANPQGGMLQSDGTIAPAPQDNAQQAQPPMSQGSPESANTQPPNQASGPNYGPGAPEYRQPYNGQHAPSPDVYAQQNGYSQQGYPQQQSYPQQQGSPQQQGYPQAAYGGQPGGEMVTIPNGTMVRIRINQTLDSSRTQPGTKFDGVVVNDVVAGGLVAIPRGATIQGTVVDVKKSGALSGRGELSLQLTQVTLAGKSFPLISDVWTHNGANKTTETVNRTAIGGAFGALIGAAAGGGAGAAIGAGVGGALGLGSSAAAGNGQMYIPSEGLLSFQLAQPATLATVSQQEMDRLAQGVSPGPQGQPLQRRPAYYRAYPPYPYPY